MYLMFIEGELKPGKKDEFLKAWNNQILPLLKEQAGFLDEILLFEENSPSTRLNRDEIWYFNADETVPENLDKPCGLSFWKTKEHAEHYRRDVLPQMKNFVGHLLSTTPKLRGFNYEAAEMFKISDRKVA
jgi:hypothetical protein